MLAAPRGFEPRFTDPKSAVLPLDEGAAPRPGQRKWSGRRDSNPRPSPWQGDALPTEPLPPARFRPPIGGAESQNRTGDTAIFSRVLYQLSYLGPMANQALAARRRREITMRPDRPANPGPAIRDRCAPYSREVYRAANAGRNASESVVSGGIWHRPCPVGLRRGIGPGFAAPMPPDRRGRNTPCGPACGHRRRPYSSPASVAASGADSGASPVSTRSRLIRSTIAG